MCQHPKTTQLNYKVLKQWFTLDQGTLPGPTPEAHVWHPPGPRCPPRSPVAPLPQFPEVLMGCFGSGPTKMGRKTGDETYQRRGQSACVCTRNGSAVLTRKSSIVTAREFMTSASMVSSSRSIRSIFLRMACKAASEHKAAKSAPTCPWVSLATCREKIYLLSCLFRPSCLTKLKDNRLLAPSPDPYLWVLLFL